MQLGVCLDIPWFPHSISCLYNRVIEDILQVLPELSPGPTLWNAHTWCSFYLLLGQGLMLPDWSSNHVSWGRPWTPPRPAATLPGVRILDIWPGDSSEALLKFLLFENRVPMSKGSCWCPGSESDTLLCIAGAQQTYVFCQLLLLSQHLKACLLFGLQGLPLC